MDVRPRNCGNQEIRGSGDKKNALFVAPNKPSCSPASPDETKVSTNNEITGMQCASLSFSAPPWSSVIADRVEIYRQKRRAERQRIPVTTQNNSSIIVEHAASAECNQPDNATHVPIVRTHKSSQWYLRNFDCPFFVVFNRYVLRKFVLVYVLYIPIYLLVSVRSFLCLPRLLEYSLLPITGCKYPFQVAVFFCS